MYRIHIKTVQMSMFSHCQCIKRGTRQQSTYKEYVNIIILVNLPKYHSSSKGTLAEQHGVELVPLFTWVPRVNTHTLLSLEPTNTDFRSISLVVHVNGVKSIRLCDTNVYVYVKVLPEQ